MLRLQAPMAVSVLFALGTLSPVGAFAADAVPSNAVGQVTFLVGKAQQIKEGVSRPLRRGDVIEPGSSIETANNGHVHVRFVDGALVSIRPASALRVTEYKYDQSNPAASKVKFELIEGTARAVTGSAGKAAKDNFRLNTPVAALGVRGTDFSVFSSMSESLVSVNSGAVVVSQFGDGCSRTGSGPCSGAGALEVRAGSPLPGVALVSVSNSRPVVLPAGTVKLASAAVSPPAEREANASVAAESAVSETVVRADVDKALASGSSVTLPTSGQSASKFVWGRWYASAWPGDQTLSFRDARVGRSVTVGNEYVALYRANESPFVIPDKGSARLALQSGQVYWMGDGLNRPGKIDNGSLTIQFADKRFNTSLTGSHDAVGAFNLQASGALATSFFSQGMFVSDPSTSNARVAGAINSNATEAGYFFEQPAGSSRLFGTTNWRR